MRITEAMFINEIYEKFTVPPFLVVNLRLNIARREQLYNRILYFVRGARIYADLESSTFSEDIAKIVLERIIKDLNQEV